MANLIPFLFIGAALSAGIFCEGLIEKSAPVPAQPAPSAVPVMPDTATDLKTNAVRKAIDGALAALPFTTPTQVWIALWLAVIIAYVSLTYADLRERLKEMFHNLPVRPLPALRIMDLLAVVFVYIFGTRILLLLAMGRSGMNGGGERAEAMLLHAGGLGLGIFSGIFLARHRARHPRGSLGLWPFWKLAPGQKRSLWWDVLIGVLAYPPSLLIVGLCSYVNYTIVYLIGHKPDEHPLINELVTPQSPGVLAIFFIMATFGAAFFEELLFRGILYNVSRRYVGALSGATIAGLIFALMHHIESQILGLFVLALILTWLYDRTGRLVAGMTLHAVNNFVALALTLFASNHLK